MAIHVLLLEPDLIPASTALWLMSLAESRVEPSLRLIRTPDMAGSESLLDLQPARVGTPHGGYVYVCRTGGILVPPGLNLFAEQFLHQVGIDALRSSYTAACDRAIRRDRLYRRVRDLPVTVFGLLLVLLCFALAFFMLAG